MTRNLYRVAFAVMTPGDLSQKIESIRHVLIQVPSAYIGLPKQIEKFETHSFDKFFKKSMHGLLQKVKYVASEKIPDLPQTFNEIQPDMVIDPVDWM